MRRKNYSKIATNKIFVCFTVLAVVLTFSAPSDKNTASLRTQPGLKHEEACDEFGQYALRFVNAEGTIVSENGRNLKMLLITLFCLVSSTIALPLAEETLVTEPETAATDFKSDNNEKVEDVAATLTTNAPELKTTYKPVNAEVDKSSEEDKDDKKTDSKEDNKTEPAKPDETDKEPEKQFPNKPSVGFLDFSKPFIPPFFSSLFTHNSYDPYFSSPFSFFNSLTKSENRPYFIILTD
ncbi:hypothetical protein K1T71_004523 [Dendrolimus kikuchii]|uniref:Uncharacterized protein n=1 Tax=Dendrolimus kikuchii TaxID=765133 RepID=A0ACC1D920_9NEOP|nr:hypothetical protein K1T71_004523 [Dendrolimus kikuchii]